MNALLLKVENNQLILNANANLKNVKNKKNFD